MLLKSTGSFLEFGLQESCAEFWTSADDSSASDEIRWSCVFFPLLFLISRTFILGNEPERSLVESQSCWT